MEKERGRRTFTEKEEGRQKLVKKMFWKKKNRREVKEGKGGGIEDKGQQERNKGRLKTNGR